MVKIAPLIPIGSVMGFQVTFLDGNQQPFDPETVQIIVNDPNGGSTTYSESDNTLTKTDTGIYTVNVEATIAGDWIGRGIGTLPNGSTVTTLDGHQYVEGTSVTSS